MKVLHAIAGIDPKAGGPSRSVPGLCRALSCSGVETWLLSFSPDHELSNPKGVHYIKGNGIGYKAALKTSRIAVESVVSKVVHIHCLWLPANHAIAKVSIDKSIPIVIAPRGMLEPWSLNTKKWKKRIALWLYQRHDLKSATVLHATADSEAGQFRKLGFTQPIVVSPNGVDFPDVMPSRTRREDGKKTALFLSRIHPKKGLMELVEAWAWVKGRSVIGSGQTNALMNSRTNELLNWHFEFAGPDSDGHLAEVQKRIKELGVERDFTYLGNLNDTEKWITYRQADLFILPTYCENFGIVIAEALAAGVPVCTTTGTPWKALVDKRCGWWIEPGLDALVNVLPDVLRTTGEQLNLMGERGRHYAYDAFSWDAVAMNMKQTYEWVLGDGDKPECVWL